MSAFQDTITKLTNAFQNIQSIIRKHYDMYYNNTPMDVPVEFYDIDGNLVSQNIPNLAKWKQGFSNQFSQLVSKMSVTYYVDAVNGDDNNPGTQDAPFQTLKKAVDSVPVGGKGVIILAGSTDSDSPIEYRISGSDIVVTNKYIELWTNGSGKFAKITQDVFIESNIFNHALSFVLIQSSIVVISNDYSGYIFLENPKRVDTSLGWVWHHKALFQIHTGFCVVGLYGWPPSYPQIHMTDEGGSNIVCINSRNAGPAFGNVNFWFLNAVVENTNCKIVDFYQTDSHTSGAIDARIASLKDVNGNDISFADVISGRILDSTTGLCKNVLSATI